MAPKTTPTRPVAAFAGAAFLESLFVPFLIDALLLGLVLRGAPLWRMIAFAIPASVLGTLLWYAAGVAYGAQALAFAADAFAVSPTIQDQAARLWTDNWVWGLLAASLTAIPDPLAAALAGAHGAPLLGVLGILLLSHALRFALMGGIIMLARGLVRRGTAPLQTWVRRLALGASLTIGAVFGAAVLIRVLT